MMRYLKVQRDKVTKGQRWHRKNISPDRISVEVRSSVSNLLRIVVGDALLCASTEKNAAKHTNIMIKHNEISDSDLRIKIKKSEICFGGNRKLKIYGTLKCSFGKRMKRENRVFFLSENEAKQNGFRPCGHCMRTEYQNWKNGLI